MTAQSISFEKQVMKIYDNLHLLDYYFLLGLQPNTPVRKIVKQYQQVAAHFAPSRHTAADPVVRQAIEEIFNRLREAYQVLTNADKRLAYDQQLKTGSKRYSQPPADEHTSCRSSSPASSPALSPAQTPAQTPAPRQSATALRRAIAPVPLASGTRSSSRPPAPVRRSSSVPPRDASETRSSSQPPAPARRSSVPPAQASVTNKAAMAFYEQALRSIEEGNYQQAQLLATMARAKLMNNSHPLIGKLITRIYQLRHKTANLSTEQQQQVAASDNQGERKALERTYGSRVWSVLLSNPKLSSGEVVRIAQQKTITVDQVTLILNNPHWCADDAVQRALLWNPRLDKTQITDLLSFIPRSKKKQLLSSPSCPIWVKKAAG